jgi:succinoglycan biosynthesis transport protein ExoP
MNLMQLLLILLARRRIIVVTMVVTVAAAVAVSLVLPKTYKATASVLLNYKGVDPLTGLALPGQLLPGYMPTQVDIITSKRVAGKVVDQLKLTQQPELIAKFNAETDGKGTLRNWIADSLLKKLEVIPSRESSVIEVNFKGIDPEFVAAAANAFVDEYQKAAIELKVEPMRKASAYYDSQTRQLRNAVEVAQNKLSKYQQENGIVSVENRLDVESNRLNDLSSQLVTAQGQSMEAMSRRHMAQGAASAESPDVAASVLIQNLKINLGSAESKFADISQRLAQNHPLYISAKAEVDKLRADLNTQLKIASNSIVNNSEILTQREGAVRTSLAAQKAKVLELNRTRDELGILMKDVEAAQHAFDVTAQRFSQIKLEGQAEQSDISVLNAAIAPLRPSWPKMPISVLLALLLGPALGVGLALIAEVLNRRVRSERDVSDVLKIPVLGAIEWNAAKRPLFGLKNKIPARLRLN